MNAPTSVPFRPLVRRVFLCAFSVFLLGAPLHSKTDPAGTLSARLDQARAEPGALTLSRSLGERAQALVFAKETPLVTRAKDANGLAAPRHLKPAIEPATPEDLAKALARDDEHLARQLVEELPELAAAYRLSGLGVLKLRVLQQLTEIASWRPLARCEAATPESAQTNTAFWLTLRTLQDTLEIFPKEDLPADLAAKIDLALLEASKPLFADLRGKRPEFLKDPVPPPGAEPDAPPPSRREAASSTEWILFNETIISLGTRLGPELCREEYTLALNNIRLTLRNSDASGAWRGGIGKAMEDHLTLARCARTLASRGETWLAKHEFLSNQLGWIANRLLPARSLVNTGDTAGLHPVGLNHGPFRRFLSRVAVLSGQPQSWFLLQKWFSGPSEDRYGIIALCDFRDAPATQPPLWSFSPLVPTLVWRSNWGDYADAVWTTAGHPGDPDTHLDRGHVSYFRRGRPVLIEAGTPPPGGDAGLAAYFSSQAAHNVIQIGNHPLVAASCSIRNVKLAEEGGTATLILTPATNGVATSWSRKLEWDNDKLVITDNVTLPPETLETIRFRFHLGDSSPVLFTKPTPQVQSADSPVGRLEFRTNGQIILEQSAQTDFTLFSDAAKPEPSTHTCVEVRTAKPVSAFRLETRVLSR